MALIEAGRALDGKPLAVDEILEAELQELSDMQAARWRMDRDAHQRAAIIDERIRAGAVVVSARFEWDAKNRMVRTRKEHLRSWLR